MALAYLLRLWLLYNEDERQASRPFVFGKPGTHLGISGSLQEIHCDYFVRVEIFLQIGAGTPAPDNDT